MVPSPHIDRLTSQLLDGIADPALGEELVAWLSGSLRFRAFAEANRDKIHKKLRTAGDDDARGDVRAELLVARQLLADRRLDLAFEPRGSNVGGPDFAVTHRGHHAFDLEVTRPRRSLTDEVIATVVLVKLRQLPPSVPNVLVVTGDGDGPIDIAGAVRRFRARADAKDHEFFARRGFDGTRQFYDRFLRLGAVIVWRPPVPAEAWRSGSARIPVPDRALAALVSAIDAPTATATFSPPAPASGS